MSKLEEIKERSDSAHLLVAKFGTDGEKTVCYQSMEDIPVLFAEIESLKAITELAVKGLKQIVKGDEAYHTTIFEAKDWIDKIEVIADTTLSEIERLSHEQT
jgi:hypothetical protein